MEEVTKCKYIDCLDAREKEHILHELPVCDISLCVRWLINSGHVDLIGKDLDALRSMKFFVCNSHFTEDCYLSKGTLKENAVPSPHWSNISRMLKTAKARRKVQLNGQENCTEEASMYPVLEKNCPFEFEVDQWCRTCATKKQNLVSMTTKGKGTEMSLLSKLKLLIEIDDEDALPTKMCDECVDKLEQSFKFFQQIYIADNTLRHVFPNTRLNSMPRKPLHTLGEHMRKEQTEKIKEKKEASEQQDCVPRVTRGGFFRRGRGRPRTRGYAGRARSRHRQSQITLPISNHSRENNTVENSLYDYSVKEPVREKNKYRNEDIPVLEEQRQGGTVFSLLTDTCHSDEELDWSDVIKLMNRQEYKDSKENDKFIRVEEKLERKVETDTAKAETTATTKTTTKTERETEVETKRNIKKKSIVKIERTVRNYGNTTKEYKARCIRCKFCNEAFQFRRQLEIHLVSKHSQLSGYTCTDCLACYENESLLSKHRAMRHGQRRYRCEHCQEEFIEKRVLREHVNECQSHDTSYYFCELCSVTFVSKQILVEHMKSHPESSIASLESDLGDSKTIDNSSILSSKVVQVKQERECCSVTVAPSNVVATLESNPRGENSTSLNSTFETNTRQQEQKDEKFENCPDCNEKVDKTVEPSIHRIRCNSAKRKDTTCLLCDKCFSSVDEYERHVLDHCKRLRVSP
ncbi:uncharacterized protein LOC143342539 [Colletes latitarsis]|uniref:uncharacterized protein LOC143342539 n=1 Tax=Colletes latitarsis TaxID=2605962 RepID=UPI0040375BC4